MIAAGVEIAERLTEGAGGEEMEDQTLNDERIATRIRFCARGMEMADQGQPPAPDVNAVQQDMTPVTLNESWAPSLQSMSIGWRGSAREVERAYPGDGWGLRP